MPTQIVVAIDDQSNIDAWGLRPYGTWAAGTYPKGAVVTHSGSLWVAGQNTSQTPGVGPDWTILVPSVVGSTGAMFPQGAWNATTNVPALASGVGTEGYVYRVSTAGTTTLDTMTNWNVGDLVIFLGGAWRKIRGNILDSVDITDSTAAGRTLLTAADAVAQRSALGFTWNYPGGALPGYVWMSNDGATNRPYPLGDSANTIPFINQFGSIAVKPPANSVTWSFYTTTSGMNNQSGFYQDASNRMFMQLSKTDGSLGTRFGSDGVDDVVQGLPAFMCRAWVNFNGTGTIAIRASGNVSSITDNGAGDYTVNLTTAMPDANYAVSAICQRNDTNDGLWPSIKRTSTPSTTAVRIATSAEGSSIADSPIVCVAIFR